MTDKSIYDQLKDLSTNELVNLQKAITQTLEERDVSEDVIKEAVRYLKSIQPYGGSVRFTTLTLYLEKQEIRRESIARRLVNMWKKNHSMSQSGCPIGEQDSHENPIYPHAEGVIYNHICYIDYNNMM